MPERVREPLGSPSNIWGTNMDLMGLVKRLDVDKLAKDFMQKMKVGPLDMYFVVAKYEDDEHYEMLGMAYAEGAAKEIKRDHARIVKSDGGHIKILRFDMGRLLKIVEDMGAAQE